MIWQSVTDAVLVKYKLGNFISGSVFAAGGLVVPYVFEERLYALFDSVSLFFYLVHIVNHTAEILFAHTFFEPWTFHDFHSRSLFACVNTVYAELMNHDHATG